MIADKACWERGCACHDHWSGTSGVDLMKKDWVGLTDEEMYEAVRPLCKADSVARALFDVSKDEYRAIESLLKQKNT